MGAGPSVEMKRSKVTDEQNKTRASEHAGILACGREDLVHLSVMQEDRSSSKDASSVTYLP